MEDPSQEQRRARRLAEQRRRAATRRRNALIAILAVAAVAVVAIVLAGGGDDGARPAKAGSQPAPAAEPTTGAAAAVPTVTGFDGPVPILMYHAISPPPPGAPLPGLFVPEAEFEAQMKWLAARGYHGVTLADVFAAWREGEAIAEKPVVVSFDDGLQSQYVGARPMLERLGWPAVLNLEIDHLKTGDLTAAQVTELVDSGWELDSHTFSHPDLTEAGVDLEREVAASRAYLERKFDTTVDFFCYPAGAYDEAVVAAVKAAGYEGATTTNEGLATPAEDPFELSRIRVEPGDGAAGLGEKLGAARG